MPDETKKYLINVESNLDEYAKRADEARKRVDEFIQSNADLLDKNKEMTPEMERRAAQLKVLQQDYKNAQKAVENATRVDKAQKNSYEELYQAWKNAQTQLKLMPNAYNVSANGVRTLSAEYLKQKQVVEDAKRGLDAFGKGVADNRLNVGNYSEAIEGALGQMRNLPGAAGQAAQGLSGMASGFKAVTAASPLIVITLVINGIQALTKAFKAFDPIIDKIQQTMKGLTAVFSTLRDSIIGLISGQKTLGETFRSLGSNIREAYDEGVAWMKLQQELDDMNGLLIESEAKLRREIDELILQSKDRTKSEKERSDLIDQALIKEKQLYNERKAIADRERLIAEEAIISGRNLTDEQIKQLREVGVAYAIQLKDTKDVTDAEITNLANAIAKQERILNDSVKIKEMAINRQNLLLDKAEAAEQKRQEKREADAEKAKIAMEKAKADLQKELDDYKKFIRDQQKADKDARQAKRDKELEQAEWERNQKLINAENLLAIQEQNDVDQFSIQRQRLELSRQQEIQAAQQTGADVNLINQKYLLAQRKIEQLAFQSKLSLYAGFAGSVAQIFGETTAIGKLAGIAQATINTYQAASEALAAYPPPFSYVAMASAIVAGIANVKKIIAVKSGLPGDTAGGSVPTPTAITGSQAVQRTFAQQVGSTILTQPTLSQQQVNALPNQNVLTAEDIASAVAKIPAPIVTVEDINARADEARKVEVRGTI